jgi:phosphoglycolate phosphatase
MSASLRLVIFDVDGTLVDSQGAIVAAMAAAFEAVGLPVPDRKAILSIVGLSLDHAMFRLVPEQPESRRARLVHGYKDAYHANRVATGAATGSPLYPGASETIARLNAKADILLGVATGKSQRGLDALLEAHDLTRVFVTRQVADHHPSKPHPSMILAAMAEAGVGPAQSVMIGDTSYDMEMARAAQVPGIGVGWGYHEAERLKAAHRVIHTFDQLPEALEHIWKVPS